MAKVKKAVKATKAVKLPKGANRLNKKKLRKTDLKKAQQENVTKAEAKGKAKQKKIQEKPKPKPDPLRSGIVMQSVAETLQNVAFEGEFDLPSMLTRYLEKSHPLYGLGLHREYYIPIGSNVSFYDKNSNRGMQLFYNQATIVSSAIVGEGIPRREKDFDPPFCREHK